MSEGVVIVGGGLAAQRCIETLTRGEFKGPIRVVCAETHTPYDRPPLSKELLAADADESFGIFRPREWYAEQGVELLSGVRAGGLDPVGHTLTLDDGGTLAFERLVIASGARPRLLPAFAPYANVSTLRTREDARLLRELLAARRRLLIVGAGFIGLEVAAAACAAQAPVAVVERETELLGGLLGSEVGAWLADIHRAAGVDLVLGGKIAEIEGDQRVEAVALSDGQRLSCDHVLVAVGVLPDLDWLHGSGLASDNGIPTDASGRTELPDIYAAGDAAAGYDTYLERHILSGHWESASRQGIAVGNALLGRDVAPPALASFWSVQYGMRLQYLGHAPLADAVRIDGEFAARDFTAEYSRDGVLVAAVTVGRPRAVAELRERLAHLGRAPGAGAE
jgi:NADPH-dependent 2,4-dienoyl-CoA reductase/sulfur reductase-like enzyme